MMQNKLVENWLTSAKELSFTTPFVQLLITEGYKVLHVSRGGAVEQGKDVIALNKNGEVCCFQLKCDDISVSVWYKIKSQIDELVQIPPINAALTKAPTKWKCYLVTNGNIPNATARTIVDYSNAQASNGFMSVETINKEQLVKRFVDGYGSFFPVEPEDLNLFLKMYCKRGDAVLDREEFKKYFELSLGALEAKSKQKKREGLQAASILCSYLLTNKYLLGNHVENINAWCLLLFTLLHFAEKWKVDIRSEEDTIVGEIESLYTQLIQDVDANETLFVDGAHGILSEAVIVHKIRCTELVGHIAAYLNYCLLLNKDAYFSEQMMLKLLEMAKYKALLGECNSPLLINYIVALELLDEGKLAAHTTKQFLEGLLSVYANEGRGIPSPYYSMSEVVEWALSMPTNRIEESFQNRAYCFWVVVLLLARFGEREVLDANWQLISYISNQEIVPEDPNDLLLWRVDDAQMVDTFPSPEQSWKSLVESANASMQEYLPTPLQNRKYLLPFFINAMPHRCSHKTVLAMLND